MCYLFQQISHLIAVSHTISLLIYESGLHQNRYYSF